MMNQAAGQKTRAIADGAKTQWQGVQALRFIAGICTYFLVEQPVTRRLNRVMHDHGLYDPAPAHRDALPAAGKV